MKNSVLSIICRILFVFVWAQQFSFSQSNSINLHQSNCGSTSGNIFGSPFVDEQGRCLATSRENDAVYVAGNIGDSTLLLKVDLTGNLIWSRVIDVIPAETEVPSGIVADADGMIAVVGTGGDQVMGGTLYAFRYNPDTHTILWSHEFTHSPNDFALGMIEKGNGGNYLLTNQPTYWAQSMQLAEVVEMDKTTGMIITSFSKNYRDHETETLFDLVFYENFVYGIGRYKNGGSVGTFRNTLVKLDQNTGDQLWVRMGHVPASGTARLYGYDLAIADNSIFSVCSGDPSGTSTSARKLFIQRTAVNGNLNWIKQYELPGANDISQDLIQSGNGLIAFTYDQITGRNFLFKIDFEGNVLWAKTFEFPSLILTTEELRSNTVLVQAGDRLVFTGFGINNTGDADVLVVQTDLDGNVLSPCVESQSISLTAQTVNNPAWYEQSPEQFDVEFQTSDNSPESGAILMPISQECVVADTLFTFIDATICEGQQYEGYTETGIYEDYFTSSIGCDSLRTLSLSVIDCPSLLYYSLNACSSYMSNGSNMDYSEFVPAYPADAGCASITATNLFRSPPQENKHSCTPGANSSIGMCISALPTCTYLPGDQASLVTEINFNPTGDSIVRLTKFEFYERSPNMYNWVNGGSGPNNYPQFYGIRVLKDGQEIYRMENIATHLNWTLQSFDFSSIPDFDIDQPATIRIEILPYCPIGNGATVSAWDIDEVNLFGGCLPSTDNSPIITGTIKTESGKGIPGVNIFLGKYASFIPAQHSASNSTGEYLFDAVDKGWKYYIKGSKNDNWLQGVNTMDLLRLQKHLLGIERFTSITQYVASDINHNGIINVTDLLDLRKALLGIYSSFPYNTSWRIGIRNDLPISSFSKFDVVNKLPPAIPQQLIFDFLGVKVGDVNQDIDPGIHQHDIISRSADVFDLKANEMIFQGGIEIAVPIIAGGDIQLEGLQLMMSSRQMELLSIQPGKIPMLPEFYAYSSAGIISISWSQVESISISKGDVLFTIILSTPKPGVLSQEIDLMQTTLLPEVYAQDETKSVNLSFESYPEEKQGERLSQVSIEPNPFTVSSTIHFQLKEISKVRFVFYDLTGQKLYEEEHEYLPGMQSLRIDNAKLHDGEGIIYCQIMTDDQVMTKRLVKIR